MPLSKNTIETKLNKNLFFTLKTQSEYSINAPNEKVSYQELLTHVEKNISFWSKISPDLDSNIFLKFWSDLSEHIHNGVQQARQRSRNELVEQTNDVLHSLNLSNLDSLETDLITRGKNTVNREISISTPSINDTDIFHLWDFIKKTYTQLEASNSLGYFSEAVRQYIKFIKEPELVIDNLKSQQTAQSIAALYYLRNCIFDNADNWNKISSEIINILKGNLASEVNSTQKALFKAQEDLSQVQAFTEKEYESLKKLEDTYKEKLKLEAPETLWNEQAKQYKIFSRWILGAIIVTSILLITSTGLVIPKIIELEDHITFISSTTIIISYITFILYIIRVLIKQFQSYKHLQITCTERAALTRFYQALIYESGLSGANADSERLIVYKALFEISDSGLVKSSANNESIDILLSALLNRPNSTNTY